MDEFLKWQYSNTFYFRYLSIKYSKNNSFFQSIFVAISAINCNSANIKRINDLISLSYKKNAANENLKIIERIGNLKKIKILNQMK